MKSASAAFAHEVLITSLFAIGFTGSAGLGAVWARHQISVLANENKNLEIRIAAVNRSCDDTAAELAADLDPSVLQRRDAQWHLGLEAPSPGQVERITEDPMRILASAENRGLLGDQERAVTFRVTEQP
jgi:hypothetical protein